MFLFLVTPCLVVAVQPCMEWISQLKKKKKKLGILRYLERLIGEIIIVNNCSIGNTFDFFTADHASSNFHFSHTLCESIFLIMKKVANLRQKSHQHHQKTQCKVSYFIELFSFLSVSWKLKSFSWKYSFLRFQIKH